ncbi:FkbM family methyltransferase [Athalassotoga saccharophila]|uniref:FkbM family methyltransferase n=1 Tax=Athalassotoga saccharophila TaxID=1441386 RepID=UPI00137A919B|nr:FkbM family methyltransferase [Athalassotoga saccharophila]BBJ28330.1 methyltransferase [Athalassotoga saccharophila]
MSHTKDLIDEAVEKVHEHLEKENDKQMSDYEPFKKVRRTNINKFTEKFGVHVTKTNQWRKIQKESSKFVYSYFDKKSCIEFYNLAVRDPESFDRFYDMLEDENSRKEYDWFVKYRVAYAFLGEGAAYELFTPRITKEQSEKLSKSIKFKDFYAEIDGFKIKVESPGPISAAFLIEQYRLPNLVEPSKGDVILDVGAYIGDTAFWFRKYVGESGKVYAFEPSSNNFKILEENVKQNNVQNIFPLKMALSDNEATLSIESGWGGKSNLSSEGSEKVKVTMIDKFVEDQKLDHVDFIKMDIEGAELGALMGGERTIKKFKPKLAICVYHKGDDLITIPNYIKSVNKDYKFYLKHNTESFPDTVLYGNEQRF